MKNSYTIFGQGFVGTNLVKYLKKRKHKVFLPIKGKYKFNKNLHNIIYCIGSDNWIKDPKKSYNANLGLVAKIIYNNKFSSFTLMSSTRLYLGNARNKTKESDLIHINPNIRNYYFNSLKLSAEALCLSFSHKRIRVVRMSNLFGNYFSKQIYLLPTLIRDSINNKKINILINKRSSKDFLSVEEAIDVLIKIIKKGKHRLYNVAFGKNIKLFKILNKIKKITNCKISYQNQHKLIHEPIININRIKKEFNFSPQKNLTESLEELILNYNKSTKK